MLIDTGEISPLPIPVYLIPDGITITNGQNGLQIFFKDSFDITQLFPDNPGKQVYQQVVSDHLIQKYPWLADKGETETADLFEGYTSHLRLTWFMLKNLVDIQHRVAAQGNLAKVDHYNNPIHLQSIPDEFNNLSLKAYLVKHLAQKLGEKHPMWTNISQTEYTSAFQVVSDKNNRTEFAINDPGTFAAQAENQEILEFIKGNISDMDEPSLLELYFDGDKQKSIVAGFSLFI